MSNWQFYFWTYVSCGLCAVVLSWLGALLIARGKLFQIFCLAEGALVGGLIEELMAIRYLYPFLGGFIGFIGSEWFVKRFQHHKNSAFICFYLFLSALLFFFTRVLLGHDTHVIQTIFGDLVTLLISEAKVMSALNVVVLVFLVFTLKRIVYRSFVRETIDSSLSHSKIEIVFFVITFVVLSLSISKLGLLFTLGASFIPSLFLSQRKDIGLYSFFIRTGLVALVGTEVGIFLSLSYPKVPTSPAVVLVVCLLALISKNGRRR